VFVGGHQPARHPHRQIHERGLEAIAVLVARSLNDRPSRLFVKHGYPGWEAVGVKIF